MSRDDDREPPRSATSRLVFGTAGFDLGKPDRHHERCLAEAWEAGITHFDTAPTYAHGAAERILGRFLRNRQGYLLTTKVGLPRGDKPRFPAPAFRLLRSVSRRFQGSKKIGAQGAATPSRRSPREFNAPVVQQGLERSLRALGTSKVHWLLYHEASDAEANAPDAVEFFREQVEMGNILHAGIAGQRDGNAAELELSPIYEVIQTSARLMPQLLKSGGRRLLSFYSFHQLAKEISDLIGYDSAERGMFEDVAGCSLRSGEEIAGALLELALAFRPDSKVVFFSSHPGRIQDTANRARERRLADHEAFARLIADSLK